MRLMEKFMETWKNGTLKYAVKFAKEEIESCYGVISDENNIEKGFFQLDKHGNMTGNDAYFECMELLSFLAEAKIQDELLMDLYEELTGWDNSCFVENLEKIAAKEEIEKVECVIEKLNQLCYKKEMIIMKEENNKLTILDCCDLTEYQDGKTSFEDMKVRALLYKYLPKQVRILIVMDTRGGDTYLEL